MKIGIFDSGIGGLSVLHEAFRHLSDAEYIFYADEDHVPYGEKTEAQIYSYADEITRFLVQQGAEGIVIACNTASAVAAKRLREKYSLPIVAMEPAVKPALEEEGSKRVLVMATKVTLRVQKLRDLLKKEHGEERTDLLAMSRFVTFAEREEFDSRAVKDYIASQLAPFDLGQVSSIVLGCTHFNYFRPVLREMLDKMGHPEIEMIDGAPGTVRRIADLLHLPLDAPGCGAIFFSSYQEMLERFPAKYYFSGREAVGEKDLAHLMHLHNQLEKGEAYK